MFKYTKGMYKSSGKEMNSMKGNMLNDKEKLKYYLKKYNYFSSNKVTSLWLFLFVLNTNNLLASLLIITGFGVNLFWSKLNKVKVYWVLLVVVNWLLMGIYVYDFITISKIRNFWTILLMLLILENIVTLTQSMYKLFKLDKEDFNTVQLLEKEINEDDLENDIEFDTVITGIIDSLESEKSDEDLNEEPIRIYKSKLNVEEDENTLPNIIDNEIKEYYSGNNMSEERIILICEKVYVLGLQKGYNSVKNLTEDEKNYHYLGYLTVKLLQNFDKEVNYSKDDFIYINRLYKINTLDKGVIKLEDIDLSMFDIEQSVMLSGRLNHFFEKGITDGKGIVSFITGEEVVESVEGIEIE